LFTSGPVITTFALLPRHDNNDKIYAFFDEARVSNFTVFFYLGLLTFFSLHNIPLLPLKLTAATLGQKTSPSTQQLTYTFHILSPFSYYHKTCAQ
jgi:cytochrome c biogenesis protein CcdA